MNIKTRRLGLALAAVSASVACMGIGAGGAQATLTAACNGHSIAGQGSSLQNAAQQSWVTGFKMNMNGGCTTGPTVTYTATSSGRCLNTWKADGTTPVNTAVAFCGTDDAPTDAQITNINTATGGKVLSIPVAQAAIAIIVNPPAGCTIDTVTQGQVESVYRLATATWTNLGGTAAACNAHVEPIARADGSGTTYQLKHFFTAVTTGALNAGGTTWSGNTTANNSYQLPDRNTLWPSAAVTLSKTGCLDTCPVGAGAGSGGGDEVRTVGATPNSIGYAALSDARAVAWTTSAPGVRTYSNLKWVPLKLNGALTPVADPSSNGFTETKGTSNCVPTAGAYTNVHTISVPNSATASWADVYQTNPGNQTYGLCTLTWVTALTDYTHWGATSSDIATTVRDYLHYVVNPLGGQADGLGVESDYQVLPSDIREVATTGVQEITG